MGLGHFGLSRPCPLPPPADAPAPPAPAPSGPNLTTMTGSGTGRNGPAKYQGFTVTLQGGAGPVRVYNGPDTNYPLIHEVLSPVVGEFYAPSGVDLADDGTWPTIQTGWVVHGGTGQTVQYAFSDDLDLSDDFAEPEPGQVFWWHRKGTATGNGSGSSRANGINGAKALDALINNGTITRGDRVEFDHAFGPCTLASDGVDWPCGVAIGAGLSEGSAGGATNVTSASRYTGPCGIYFGTNYTGSSTAAGIHFSFQNESGGVLGGDPAFDMRGATSPTQRMFASWRAKGEDIIVTGLYAIAPDWFYFVNPTTGATRIGLPSGSQNQAEQTSYENIAFAIFGNGPTVYNCKFWGGDACSRIAFLCCLSEEGVQGASPNKRGVFAEVEAWGSCDCILIQAFGATGSDLEVPTKLRGHSFTARDGVFGRCELLPFGPGNAASHGNGVGVRAKFFGGCHLHDFEVKGAFQDAVGIAGITTAVVTDFHIHDIGPASYTRWWWNATSSTWFVQNVADNLEGNGIKTGLNYDFRSPTSWMGNDGVAGGFLNVPEQRPIIARGLIQRTRSSGITSNSSRGGYVSCVEIDEPVGLGVLLFVNTTTNRSNWFFDGLFVKKTGTPLNDARSRCMQFQTGHFVWIYNSIIWCGPAANAFELNIGGSTVVSAKNVLVRGRVNNVGGSYSSANDLTGAEYKAAAQLYEIGVGLPSGSPLLNAGTPISITTARTYGATLNRLKQPRNLAAPNVGPI